MFDHISSRDRTLAIQRLTALWALNECGLGGFLHALDSPFTGLFVGSLAMICISFICSLTDDKWQTIMTSLVIVLVIKALVSPHSPPTAYLAVVFQGVTGAIIFRFIPGLFFRSLLFVSMGLIESAIQHLLTLAILYGNTLWEAVNIWGNMITKKWDVILPFSSTRLIIIFYLGIHLLTGILIGWFVYRTINAVAKHWGDSKYQLRLGMDDKKDFFKANPGHKIKWKRYLLFMVLMSLILLAYSLNNSSGGIQKGLTAILRALAILALWFIFLAPFAIRLLQKWLNKKHEQLAEEISRTMDMFPQLLWIIDKAWNESKSLHYFDRWKLFALNTFLYILQYTSQHDSDPDRSDPQP